MFFVPSQELISRTDSGGKRPNLAQLLIDILFPKRCLGFLIFGLLPIFLLPHFQKKTLNFANMKCLEPYLENEKKLKIPRSVL